MSAVEQQLEPPLRRVVDAIGDMTRDIAIEAPNGLVVRHGEPLTVRGRITNRSRAAWPAIVGGQQVLRVGAELYAGPDHAKIEAVRHPVAVPALRPGESVDFELVLPTRRATPGRGALVVDLLYEGVTWFYGRGGSMPVAQVTIEPSVRFSTIDAAVPVDQPAFWQQHVPEYNPDSAIGIVSPRFQEYVMSTTAGDIAAKSMLTMDELAVLYALARYHYRGTGKIVDLGPLLGIGTHVMARGVAQNASLGATAKSIYSYDLFLGKNMLHFLPGADEGETGSVFWRFLEINRDYLDSIMPVPGDFLAMRWTGAPIEILFVDISKSWSLNGHLLREFFPHLVPGHSILVQQDYVHVGEPWIALTMELLDDYFERLYFIYGGTAVFRLLKPIPQELLAIDLEALPLAETDRLFERARAKAPATVGEVLKCCQAAVRIEKGDLAGGELLIAQVDPDVRDANTIPAQEFSRGIPANLAAVTRALQRARSRQSA